MCFKTCYYCFFCGQDLDLTIHIFKCNRAEFKNALKHCFVWDIFVLQRKTHICNKCLKKRAVLGPRLPLMIRLNK